MPKIVVLSSGKEEVFDLTADIISVGRGLDNQIVLQDIKSSRKHCQIVKAATNHILKDFDSGNGTFVNGQRIKDHPLKEGDQIKIGSTLLIFTNKPVSAKPSIPTPTNVKTTTPQPSLTQVSKMDTIRIPVIPDTTKIAAQATSPIQKPPQPSKPTTKILQPTAQRMAAPPTTKTTQPPITKSIPQTNAQGKTSPTQAVRNNTAQPTTGVKPPTSRRTATATAPPITRTTKRIGTQAVKPSARFKTATFPQKKKMSSVVKIALFGCLIFAGIIAYIIFSQPTGPTQADEDKVKELYDNLIKDTGPLGNLRHYDTPESEPEKRVKYRKELFDAYEEFLKEVLEDPMCKQTKNIRQVLADIKSRNDKLSTASGEPLFDISDDKGNKMTGWGTRETNAWKDMPPYLDRASSTTKETARSLIDEGENLLTKYKWTTYEFKLNEKVKELKDKFGLGGSKSDMERMRDVIIDVNNNEMSKNNPKKGYASALKKLRECLSTIQDENAKKTGDAMIQLSIYPQAEAEANKLIEDTDNKIKHGKGEEALKLLQEDIQRFEGTNSAEKLNKKLEEVSKSIKKVIDQPPQKKGESDKKPEETPREPSPPQEEPPKEE